MKGHGLFEECEKFSASRIYIEWKVVEADEAEEKARVRFGARLWKGLIQKVEFCPMGIKDHKK